MKNFLFLAITLASNFLLAQTENDKKIFMDSLRKETTEGNHHYFRIIKDYYIEKNEYEVFDYYKSGTLQTKAIYKDKNALQKTGNFTYFYENGNKKQEYITATEKDSVSRLISYYDNGNIESETVSKDKTQAGLIYKFYKNGNKKSIESYDYKRLPKKPSNKILQFWDSNNQLLIKDGNGTYLIDNSEEKIYGKVKEGNKIGEWTKIEKLTRFKNIENYDDEGNFIKGLSLENDGTKMEYYEFESRPKPKKGLQDFVTYLVKNLKEMNRNKIVSGRTLIEFVVDKDGSLGEFKFLKSIAPELDEKIIEVISTYEKWIPGFQNGRSIRAKYVLPLNFNLK